MIDREKIEEMASILFECSLEENKKVTFDNFNKITHYLYEEFSYRSLNVLYRDISNYITHISHEDNKHLQEIQIYVLLIALQKLIADRKDDSNASTQC